MGTGVGIAGTIVSSAATDGWAVTVMVVRFSIAALAALTGYLLPPSRRDLRAVVESAAIAHAAGPSLPEQHFRQLAGGWYAVLDEGWRREPRPYLAWGCLLVSVRLLVLLGAALVASGVQLWGPGAA